MSDGSLDANVVLRLIRGDIPKQRSAALDLISAGTFTVDTVAIVEVVFALGRYYQIPRNQTATLVNAFCNLPSIDCESRLVADAFINFVAHPKLSFEDCVLEARSVLAGNRPLWTFDKKLANQTSAQLVQND